MVLTSCHHGRSYFPKDVPPQEIDLVRFDNALMNVQSKDVQGTKADIRVLYDEFPVFMPLWVEDILGIPGSDTSYLAEALPAFLNDTLYGFRETNAREQQRSEEAHV